MNTRIAVAVVAAALAGCTSAPMNRDLLRQHTERNCRVQSAVSSVYAIDSTGIGMRNVAYVQCLRAASPWPQQRATPNRAA
ncbi:hypothetical protein [Dyella agri]|uniref:Lipoprotein n=1 Tax=Dyella agri TaxID=1926869 RepID=A0ABW8KKS6_9GAMM